LGAPALRPPAWRFFGIEVSHGLATVAKAGASQTKVKNAGR